VLLESRHRHRRPQHLRPHAQHRAVEPRGGHRDRHHRRRGVRPRGR
jgi:hypothetical protein